VLVTIAAPQVSEYAPAFAGYVARVATIQDPLNELTLQRAKVVARLAKLSDEQASFRYAPDKWSIKDLVGHLSDAERVFAYRLLRIGRGDTTPLPGFEESDYARAAQSDRRQFGELLAEWSVVRAATIALASSLPEADWAHVGTSNSAPMSARALLHIILGHTEHHLSVLTDRYGVR
jgi:uncharacterized damage-inducible protein DinB